MTDTIQTAEQAKRIAVHLEQENARLLDLIASYDKALDGAITLHAEVAMDTPEDIRVHSRAVQSMWDLQAALRGQS